MAIHLVSLIVGWFLIVVLGIAGLGFVGWGTDAQKDSSVSAGVMWTRCLVGFVLLLLAGLIYRNLSSPTLIAWVLLVIFGAVGPFAIWLGIADIRRTSGKFALFGGIASVGLALFITHQWLGVSNILGWSVVILLDITGLVLSGWGIYHLLDTARWANVMRIIGGLLSIGLSVAISIYWLNSAVPLQLAGWVLFVLLGICGVIVAIFGIGALISGHSGNNKDEKRIGAYSFVGGAAGTALAFVIGSSVLQLAWLRISLWNPFVVLPVTTAFIGIILVLIVNALEDALYRGGSVIDRSGEWRIVGSNAKFRDASVRDMYDYRHGRGSWAKNMRHSILTYRIVCTVVSALGLIGLLFFTTMKESYPGLLAVFNEVKGYSALETVGLLAMLLLISGSLEFIAAKSSKQK